MSDTRPIGVFDSGMGGLTVLSELTKLLPNEQFVYLGDTARVPYGSRSPSTIQRYSREIAEYLTQFNIKMLVIACNTATAHAETILRAELDIPVVGVVEPGAMAALAQSQADQIAVIGTRSTIQSEAYNRALQKIRPQVNVQALACPLFVPIVEEGWVDKGLTGEVIREYISPIADNGIECVILGCTHYPILKDRIQKEFPDLLLIDSSVETAIAVKEEIQRKQLMTLDKGAKRPRILLTDVTPQISNQILLFFGMPTPEPEFVLLDELKHT